MTSNNNNFIGKFRRFDHGIVGNLLEYGSVNPPDYDTSKITAPMALFYSENDSNAAIIVCITFYA